jgi:hypothetical protein
MHQSSDHERDERVLQNAVSNSYCSNTCSSEHVYNRSDGVKLLQQRTLISVQEYHHELPTDTSYNNAIYCFYHLFQLLEPG